MCQCWEIRKYVPFQSTIGLKQGCSLSPTLFGMYIDDFEKSLQTHRRFTDFEWPSIRGKLIPPLLYADDLIILSNSAAGLQAQLDYLQHYAAEWGLTVNLVKTEMVIFNGRAADRAHIWKYDGNMVPVSRSLVYLWDLSQ